MLHIVEGNVLDAGLEAIVNPCNTTGAYGRGLSAEIMGKYPEVAREYTLSCNTPYFRYGGDLITTWTKTGPIIVHIATKEDWRNPSRYEWVTTGLANLRSWLDKGHVTNIGLIPLGAGLGGLDGKVILDLTKQAF